MHDWRVRNDLQAGELHQIENLTSITSLHDKILYNKYPPKNQIAPKLKISQV